MLNKITVFECNTCKRQIELELDERRPYPSRCAITYKCPGLYKKVGQKNSRSTLFPPIVYGLQDYIPRGTVIQNTPMTEEDPLTSLLAGTRQLVLAATSKKTIESGGVSDNWAIETVIGPTINNIQTTYPDDPIFLYANDVTNPGSTGQQTHPFQDHTLLLELYEISTETTVYTEYYFLRGENLTQVSGIDNSMKRSVLRFNGGDNINDTNKDNITVFVNGVEVPRINSPDAISSGKYFMSVVSDSGEKAIKFVPSLTDSSNAIKIYVYNKVNVFQDPSKVRSLVFRGLPDNDVKRTTNSWGDASRVNINYQLSTASKDRFLYTCTNFEVLTDTDPLITNTRYIIKNVKAIKQNGSVVSLDPTDIHLLIGQSPFAFVDKVSDLTMNIKEAMDQTNVMILQYYQDEFGNDNIYTEKSNLADFVDSINVLDIVDSSLIPNAGTNKVNQADTLISSKYIVGYV
jgi:hypothetical protein